MKAPGCPFCLTRKREAMNQINKVNEKPEPTEPYDDYKRYYIPGQHCGFSTMKKASQVRQLICEFVMDGKLDATDLKIIQARDCSPMPSEREVADMLGIPRTTIQRKVGHIKSLIMKALGNNNKTK